MTKIKQAQNILEELGLPIAQQNEISAFTLMALCGIRKRDSWETEVWIAEIPDHLIHYNGDKFFGPH